MAFSRMSVRRVLSRMTVASSAGGQSPHDTIRRGNEVNGNRQVCGDFVRFIVFPSKIHTYISPLFCRCSYFDDRRVTGGRPIATRYYLKENLWSQCKPACIRKFCLLWSLFNKNSFIHFPTCLTLFVFFPSNLGPPERNELYVLFPGRCLGPQLPGLRANTSIRADGHPLRSPAILFAFSYIVHPPLCTSPLCTPPTGCLLRPNRRKDHLTK